MRAVTFACALLAIALLGPPAGGQVKREVDAGSSDGTSAYVGASAFGSRRDASSDILSSASNQWRPIAGTSEAPSYVGVVTSFGQLPSGGTCISEVAASFGSQAEAEAANRATARRDWLVPPTCPGQDGAQTGEAQLDPMVFVERLLREMQLPAPAPSSAPDFAVTGKTVYLQANAQPTITAAEPNTPFGPLTITAASQGIQVDWGDGSPVQGFASFGGPWPHGDVTHVYADAGVVDIVVSQDWLATWELGGLSGTITEPLSSQGALTGFEVHQLQAVLQ